MSDTSDENFLERWARRKQQQSVPMPKAPDAGRGDRAAGAESATQAAHLDTADPSGNLPAKPEPAPPLPAIDDLTADTDITGFLRKGVPEELKRLALRRMWSLDPAIRDFIEVAENQYDWNAVDGVPGFGALPKGTDMEALLAQATGAMKPKDPDEPADTVVAGAEPEAARSGVLPEDGAGGGAGETLNAADQETVQYADVPVRLTSETAGNSSVASPLEPNAKGAGTIGGDSAVQHDLAAEPTQKRRHGGALPL